MKLFFVFLIIISSKLSASKYLDTNLRVYHQSKSDSQKVNILIKHIAPTYYTKKKYDSSLFYYKKAFNISYNAYLKAQNSDLKLFFAKSFLNALIFIRHLNIESENNSKINKYHKLIIEISSKLLKSFPYDLESYAIIGDYYNNTGYYYKDIHKDSALYFFNLSFLYFNLPYKFDSLNDGYVDGIAMVNNSLATYYLELGEYNKAIYYFYKALQVKEKQLFYSKSQNNSSIRKLSSLYNNIANTQLVTKDYDEAILNFYKSLELKKKIADSNGIYLVLGMIGGAHISKKEHNKALPFIKSSIKYFEKKNDISILARYYNNLGVCYANLNEFDKAIEAYEKSLEFNKKLKRVSAYCTFYNNISELYHKLYKINPRKEYLNKAFDYAKKGEEISDQYNIFSIKDNLYYVIQNLYADKNDFKNAFKYSLLLQSIRDSLYGEEKTKAIAEAKVQYETEKKQLLIEKLNKENQLKQLTLEKVQETQKRQQTIMISIIVFLIIVFSSLLIISKMYIKIKQAHQILKQQKSELENKNKLLNLAYEKIHIQKEEIENQRDIVIEQKNQIEKIHKNLKESIDYAQYIQKAVIRPLSNIIETNIPNRFDYDVLFKPKDIVSGDFYWSSFVNNHLIIAVADCTGHGVPGALMSMLGISLLNEIVRKKEITKTSQVLETLRQEIIYSLQQKGISNEQKDGMDIGIIAINCETFEMQFSGANNNLIYIPQDSEQPIEIKGDRMPVSIFDRMDNYNDNHIHLKKGDIFYLTTDGFKDQFGGKEQKKFLQKRFIDLVNRNKHMLMSEQINMLKKELHEWMYGYGYENTQIDDITVLGMKVL